ncbi:MAG: cytochrome oxidase subunit, partial [Phycisphaerales bacterium]|nr:cytochrome oxidase subunit [Phycisphaerales bacterium]
RQNFEIWPPPNPFANPPILRPLPALAWPTVELIVMFGSCGLMAWTDRAARELRQTATKIGMWVMFALTLGVIYVRFGDFAGTGVRFNDNAYASLVWTILGTHLTYLLAAGGELFIMALYLHSHPLDEHQAHDISLTGIYWYWVVATWVVVYGLIYFGARCL